MKTKLLKIEEIKIDEKLYPRIKYSWQTAYDYAESMKSGARFPPVTVALCKGNYYLVDGRHRIEAYKTNKKKEVYAEILGNKTEKEIYLEAVKRNIAHGRQFSIQERVGVIKRLKDMHYDLGKIAEIVNIPLDKVKQFLVTKITNNISGEPIILKAPLEHFAGVTVQDNFDSIQNKMIGHSQVELLDELISLLENKLIDTTDMQVLKKLEKLAILLQSLLPQKSKKSRKKK